MYFQAGERDGTVGTVPMPLVADIGRQRYHKADTASDKDDIPGNAMPLNESRADFDHPPTGHQEETDELIEHSADLVVEPQLAKVRTN